MPYRNAPSCNDNEHIATKKLTISSFVTNYFVYRMYHLNRFFLVAFALLKCYVGRQHLTDVSGQPLGPSSSAKRSETVWTALLVKMGPTRCPEISVTICQPGRRNSQEERSLKLQRNRSLKYRYCSYKKRTWRIITLFYNTFITVLYMFRATSCSSSEGQILLIQHLV